MMSVALAFASARLFSAFSAEISPSAILCWRASMAAISGGQMNFIVTQPSTTNTIVWMNSVALRFMERSASFADRAGLLDERVGGREPQRDADADDERRVDQ